MQMNLHWLCLYTAAFAGAFAISAVATMAVRRYSVKRGFLDRPLSEAHKRQERPIALGGGIAMLVATLVIAGVAAAALALEVPERLFKVQLSTQIYLQNDLCRVIAILAGAALAALLGLWDDVKHLKAHTKFAGQFAVAIVAVILGGAQASLFMPAPWMSMVLSILWFVFMMNAVNFFDNMDGLAAGAITIGMIFFAITAGSNGQILITALTVSVAGVAGGFWLFNRAPATIYMGDSGSHLLGYFAALAAVMTTYISPDSASKFPLVMPILILALPIFDAVTVCITRTLNGKPFWVGDNTHISHRFELMGFSRAQAVALVHLFGTIFALGALTLLWGDGRTTIIVLAQSAALFVFMLAVQYGKRR